MRITAIKTYIVGEVRNFLFVLVETDEGIRGIGEAGITWREESMAGFVHALTPSLIGQDPNRIEHLWQMMFRCGFFPAGRIGTAAISAIDIALWDIKAKSLGVPVYELFGGLVRDKVVCYPHVSDGPIEQMIEDCRVKIEAGWTFVRFNLPLQGDQFESSTSVREGVALVEAVRAALGPEAEIIIDVHTRLDPHDAITLCRRLEPFRPYFVEDPVRCENPAAIGRLKQHVATPIAMGEQYATKWEFREALENDWIDFCRS